MLKSYRKAAHGGGGVPKSRIIFSSILDFNVSNHKKVNTYLSIKCKSNCTPHKADMSHLCSLLVFWIALFLINM